MIWEPVAVVAGVIGALFGFGLCYDRQVQAWEGQGDHDRYLAFIAALGCAVTIAGIALLDLALPWNAGLTALIAFAASGLPMIGGSMRRAAAQDRAALRQMAGDALNTVSDALRELQFGDERDDHAR